MEPSPRGSNESLESVRSKLRESLAASLALVSVQPNKLRAVDSSLQSEVTDSIAAPRPLETSTCNKHSVDQNPSWENPFNVNPSEPLEGNGVCGVTDLDVKSDGATESHVSKRPKLEVREDVSECLQILATKIEAKLFKLFGGVNKKYKEKGRSLLFNLKDPNNPELKERVMSGEIAPERLCSMTAEELASKELSQWRIAKAEEFAQMVVLPDSDVDIRRLVRKTHKGEFQVEVEQDDSVSVEVSVGGTLLPNIPAKTNETEAPEVPVVPEKIDLGNQSFLGNQPMVTHNGPDFTEEYMVEELTDSSFLPAIVSLDEFMGSLDTDPFEILPADAERVIPNSSETGNAGSLGSHLGYLNYDLGDRVHTSSDKPDNMDVKFTRMDSNLKDRQDHIELEASVKKDLEQEISHPGTASHGEQVWEGLLQLNVSALVTVVAFFKSGEKTTTEDWPDFLEIKGRVRVDAFEKFLQELPLSRTRAIMVVHFSWKEGSAENGLSLLCEVAESYVEDERVGFAEPAPGVELYFCPLHAKTVDMLGRHVPKEYLDTLRETDNGLIGIVVWRKSHLTPSPKLHKQNSKKHLTSKRHQEKDPSSNHSPNPNPNPNHSKPPPLPPDPPPIIPDPPGPTDDDPIDDVPPGFGPAATRDEDDLPEFDFVKGSKPPAATNQVQPMVPMPLPRPMNAPQPVEQMRALIHRYGQTETGNAGVPLRPAANHANWQQGPGLGIEIQEWNEEDDIPEWLPQLDGRAPPLLPPPLSANFRQQPPPPQLIPMAPAPPVMLPGLMPQQPRPPQMGIMQDQQPMLPWQLPGTWWGRGSRFMPGGLSEVAIPNSGMVPPCHLGGPTTNGQSYGQPGFGAGQNGMDWRSDMSRSRGF